MKNDLKKEFRIDPYIYREFLKMIKKHSLMPSHVLQKIMVDYMVKHEKQNKKPS